ncbi:hypothetical protein BC830DRAFT_1109729, partial [Chytriomyces sp. MP71]
MLKHPSYSQCITRWTQSRSDCPLDRLPFESLHVVAFKKNQNIPVSLEADGRAARLASVSLVRTITVESITGNNTHRLLPSATLITEPEPPQDIRFLCHECNRVSAPSSSSLAQAPTLIVCAICDNAFHLICVGLATLPTTAWLCRTCIDATVLSAKQGLRPPVAPVPPQNNLPQTRQATLASIRRDIARARIERVRARGDQQRLNRQRQWEEDDESLDLLGTYLAAYHSNSSLRTRQYGSLPAPPEAVVASMGDNVGSVSSLKQSYLRKRQREQDNANDSLRRSDPTADIWAQFDSAVSKTRTAPSTFDRRRVSLSGTATSLVMRQQPSASKQDSYATHNTSAIRPNSKEYLNGAPGSSSADALRTKITLTKSADAPHSSLPNHPKPCIKSSVSPSFQKSATLPFFKKATLVTTKHDNSSHLDSAGHDPTPDPVTLKQIKRVLNPLYASGALSREEFKTVARASVQQIMEGREDGEVRIALDDAAVREVVERCLELCLDRIGGASV